MKILLGYCKELNNFATNFNNFFYNSGIVLQKQPI